MIEKLKTNLSSVVGIITLVGAILGSFIAIDSRYASAKDFEEYQENTSRQLEKYQRESINNTLELRKQSLEDKIFELEIRKNPSQVDRALLNRYKEQLKETLENMK